MIARVLLAALLAVGLLGCAGGDASPDSSAAQPATPAPTPAIEVQTLVEDLDTPWAIDFAPDGRIFLTERPGRIRVVENGQLQSEPWLTLDVAAVGEGGLLGLALDPAFSENRFVYVAYTYRTDEGRLQNRLVRLREDPETGRGALDQVLLDGVAGATIHDRVEAGGNYGWPTVTGDEAREGLVPPVTRGPWAESLLFAGLRSQTLFRLTGEDANRQERQGREGARRVLGQGHSASSDPLRSWRPLRLTLFVPPGYTLERLLAGEYGRLRDVAEGPDGALYILTSNRDGRGRPRPGDDWVLRITFSDQTGFQELGRSEPTDAGALSPLLRTENR